MGSLFNNRLSNSRNITTSGTGEMISEFGIVYHVILDVNDEYLSNETNKTKFIGAIKFKKFDNILADSKSELITAFPFDNITTSLPTVQEIVKIQRTGAGIFYERMYPSDTPNLNAISNQISTKSETSTENRLPSSNISAIRNQQQTGISSTNADNSLTFDGYGKYFNFEPGIHKLKLYEGDTTIESRFGQSIRFSGYNNPKKVFSPTLIIRNGENSISRALPADITTEEDVNKDGSIISLSSGEFELGFQPGTVDKNGKSDFLTKPVTFDGYPQKLNGDQILLNSGRIILSAKTGEMIFYSKKNYGFVSDGALSIDNKLGIDISVGDDIFVMTNGRNVTFTTDNGSINLGNKEPEPMVKGQQLVNIMYELMEAIVNMQFLTPSGPSKIGPENKPKFEEISGKLNNILSKLNQTS